MNGEGKYCGYAGYNGRLRERLLAKTLDMYDMTFSSLDTYDMTYSLVQRP